LLLFDAKVRIKSEKTLSLQHQLKKKRDMTIERTASEFVIRFPITANMEHVQDMIDYLRYKELTANYSVAQTEVDKLAQEINLNWWKQNSDKFEK
jgi:hypothetical protein